MQVVNEYGILYNLSQLKINQLIIIHSVSKHENIIFMKWSWKILAVVCRRRP